MYHRLSSPTRFLRAQSVATGHPYTLAVEGHGGVPGSGVSAVAMNIYAGSPAGTSTAQVTVWPSGAARPLEANTAVSPGQPHTNFSLVQLGSTGSVSISVDHASVPITVDVAGWYSADASTTNGTGGAHHTYLQPSILFDSRTSGGAFGHGVYEDIPVDFTVDDTPHITSLAVQFTAFGSSGSGTLTAWATGQALPSATAIVYGPNSTTTNYGIVRAGTLTSGGRSYPSISVLNNGPKPVQVIVSILGYYDDGTLADGERYFPNTPLRLGISGSATAHTQYTLAPGPSANAQTHALNLESSVGVPTATTAVGLWADAMGVGFPPQAQLRADADRTTFAATIAPVGTGNQVITENSTGSTTLSVWSFGHFDTDAAPMTAARDPDGPAPRSAFVRRLHR
jgi:hypothetical protein